MSSVRARLTDLTLRGMALLPLRINQAIGAAFGWMVHQFPNRQSRYIDQNLALCFPDMSSGKRARLVRDNMIETGKNLTELSAFWHWPQDEIRQLVVEEINRDVLNHALQENKGVIVAAPHSGAWELIGMHLTCEQTMHFLYRPNKKAHLNEMILSARERFGGKCHPITARGLSALVRALKKGEMIGILPDQEPNDEHGVFAPLYGVPAYTMTFLSALARKTGAPVIFAVMERMPKGKGYRLHYLRADEQIAHEDPHVACTTLNRYVEACINVAPSQYMWNYRRFRKTPDNTNNRYRK